jgi:long-chain acyl-CoA synthetase
MNKDKPWLDQYPANVPAESVYPFVTLNDILTNSAEQYPDDVFLQAKDRRFTYAEVSEIVINLAKNLIWLGIEKGDRVALILPNTPEYVYSYFGILKAGAIVVAINPAYKHREIIRELQDARVRWVITSEILYADIKQIQPMTGVSKIIVARTSSRPGEDGNQREPERDVMVYRPDIDLPQLIKAPLDGGIQLPEISPEDPAVFQFTGGITGTPKTAVGLHKNLAANVYQFRQWLPDLNTGRRTFIVAIPLFHVYGMVLGMILGTLCGAKLIIVDQVREIEKLVHAIETEKPDFFPAVPALIVAMNKYCQGCSTFVNISSLQIIISGASALSPQVKQNFEQLCHGKVLEGYGLSEAPTATHCNPITGENHPGSIGLPLPGVECRVIDLETNRDVMLDGAAGELWVKGPQIMQGYYQSPEETEKALVDGWLRTGDIVRMDADGYFYILGRTKELIKVGGMQVWPAEVEEVLLRHPAVIDCGVGGVQDSFRGEVVKAWVVIKPGFALEEEELIEWCKPFLVSYKIPAAIYFVKEIPRTSVGKIRRQVLIHGME